MADTKYTINKLIDPIKSKLTKSELKLLTQAFDLSLNAHINQKRYSGAPYFEHLYNTAENLISWQMDTSSIIAGLLHDTVEDAEIPLSQIESQFGSSIAMIVDGVTKVGQIRLRNSQEHVFLENLRKMIIASSKDIRVIVVKLADRLDNIRTLKYVPKDKQTRIAKETLEIYAPIAERLSMGIVKRELEDLAFAFADPEKFKWTKNISSKFYKKAEDHNQSAIRDLQKILAQNHIPAKVHGRTKGVYSLYNKLIRTDINKDINLVYDLVAMRIIVPEISQCYAVLGIIHNQWRPVPWLGIKDYIAQPKPNGYQSIHTKVFRGQRIIEIQIRTTQMHDQAEYGIAAHWHYAQTKSSNKKNDTQALEKGTIFADQSTTSWVKDLAQTLNDLQSQEELINHLKLDMFQSRIFVLTPLGDVINLPQNATPIDFAFAVHSDLGKYIKACRVNGKIVPLSYKLKHGDICEIIKHKNPQKLPRDWLNFVVTHMARTKISREYQPSGSSIPHAKSKN